ncbi:hypothetical protein BN946_scf184998.g51 [Trametes cinnabarina]|uniref:Hydrophobin n=1 Tax=Pycnoporus cinnabarinus TaxID=5643 RepID=A0A060S8E8_PYCCI|nr:hypothetical protein BN946_scf184998.g51 [Trametes cinnabarina]
MRLQLSFISTAALALLASAKPHEPRCDSETTHVAPSTSPAYTHTTHTYKPQPTYTPSATRTWRPQTSTVTTTDWEPQPTVTVFRTATTTRTATATETVTTGGANGGHPHHWSSSVTGSFTIVGTPPPTTHTGTTTAAPSPTGSGSPGAGAGSGAIPAGECNTGSIQCCDQVQDAKSPQMSGIMSSLGIDPLGVTGLAGTSCSPIDILALGGGDSCTQMPVCCNNNTYQGLINIGCVPILLQL